MKTSKILITSLLAAAAMSANAFGGTLSGTAGADGTVTLDSTNVTKTGTTYATSASGTTVGTLSIEGGYTVKASSSAWGFFTIGSASALTGTGTLEVNRTGAGAWSLVTFLDADTAFAGTIKISSAGSTNQAICLSASAASATLNLANNNVVGYVSAENVSIAGLDGVAGATFVSRAKLSNSSWTNGPSTFNDATVRTLTLSGSGTYDFAGTVGSTMNQSSLNLTKSGTGMQTLSGTTYLGNLDVSGGELVLSGTANIAGTTTVGADGELDLSGGTITLASAIANLGTVTVDSETKFNISSIPALRSMKNADGSFSVISGGNISGWDTLSADDFTFNGAEFAEGSLGRYSGLTVGDNGKISFATTAANLVWSNASGDGLWNTTSGNWTNGSTTGDTFVSYDSVEFNTDAAVTVDSAGVRADLVTISAGTVSFTGGTITALGGVSVTGGTLNLSTNVFAAGTAFSVSGGELALGTAFSVTAGTSINVTDAGTVTGTITSMAAGTSLTLAGTGEASSVTLGVSDGNDRQISGDLTIGNATVTTARNDIFNYDTTVDRTLKLNSGGELAIGSTRQSFDTNWKITLNGGKISGGGDTNGYALDFFESNTVTVTADSEISANLCMRGGNTKTLAFNVDADKTLTVSGNIVTPASGANAVLVKQGSGTLVLSGENTYNQGTRIEAGTVVAGSATALGTETVNVTGDATLQMNPAVSTFVNDVSVADGKTLSVQALATDFTGTLSGNGNVSVKTLYGLMTGTADVLTLSGDNTDLAGTLRVGGLASINAKHVNALGSGMLEITKEKFDVVRSGTVNAAVAGVKLNNVSISLKDASTAVLTADESCNFTVAEGATLYLDIGELTAATLKPGEEVALMIAEKNAITTEGFFETVLVGTYGSGNTWIDDTEWAYKAGSWDATEGTLWLISVPEPSVFGLLAGLGALALAGTRRRRKKA